MIGIDTNVLVRYLTQDDPRQSALANKLFQRKLSTSKQGYISLIVLAELCWVLEAVYEVQEFELIHLVQGLLATPQFALEKRDTVDEAIKASRISRGKKAGLVDFLIQTLSQNQGCEYCLTFDKTASRSAGMKLLDDAVVA